MWAPIGIDSLCLHSRKNNPFSVRKAHFLKIQKNLKFIEKEKK
ncbi:hypothetical protein HMPREF9071_0574 [Capnocytophaga sp. oral taxon 338 str. F0234]|nr:hypothetical protein HMPREF9071_0574 [Capnocytophaga sp. oral taxon 338 str. F0234]